MVSSIIRTQEPLSLKFLMAAESDCFQRSVFEIECKGSKNFFCNAIWLSLDRSLKIKIEKERKMYLSRVSVLCAF